MMKPEQTTLFPTDDPQPTTGTKQGQNHRTRKADRYRFGTQKTPHLLLSTESRGDLARWRKRAQGWCS